jgi:hypothetical protein
MKVDFSPLMAEYFDKNPAVSPMNGNKATYSMVIDFFSLEGDKIWCSVRISPQGSRIRL